MFSFPFSRYCDRVEMPFCKLLHIENENWTWNFDTEMSLRYIVILDQPHHLRCPFFWLLLMMSDVGIVKWVNEAGYFRKKLSSAIIMIKYNHDFWPLCIFFFRPSVHNLLQRTTSVSTKSDGYQIPGYQIYHKNIVLIIKN